MLPRRASVLTGAITTALFLFFGASFISQGQTWFGGALVALGLFRGLVVVRQLLRQRQEDDASR